VSSVGAASYGTSGVINTSVILTRLAGETWENEELFWKKTSGSAFKTVSSTKILCQMSRGMIN
jgi:hypothetical protein